MKKPRNLQILLKKVLCTTQELPLQLDLLKGGGIHKMVNPLRMIEELKGRLFKVRHVNPVP